MSVPVSMIPYANMAPYRQLGAPQGCHFVPQVPKESIRALMAGRVAAAAVPVGGLAALGQRVETVGRFGIAAKGPSMSVLLFSRYPFERMRAPRTLRLTGESATSVRLLYLLLGHTVGFDKLPHVTRANAAVDGELLIGDRALINGQTAGRGDQWPHATDLSQVWFERHQQPFVFARWVVRKDASARIKGAISDWLERFKEQEDELVAQAIPGSASRLQLGEEVLQRYFQVIRRSLNQEDLCGQQLFSRQFDQVGREPLFYSSPRFGANHGRTDAI